MIRAQCIFGRADGAEYGRLGAGAISKGSVLGLRSSPPSENRCGVERRSHKCRHRAQWQRRDDASDELTEVGELLQTIEENSAVPFRWRDAPASGASTYVSPFCPHFGAASFSVV